LFRSVTRRLERLEERVADSASQPFCCRIRLVHPENGCTGVLLIESGKPMTQVPPTAEDIEEVRADLERRRAARLPQKGGASDTHDLQPA
jgi:hypothetical protein